MRDESQGPVDPVAAIEYEQMLLSRYAIARHRGDHGPERSAYLFMSRIQLQGPMTIAELGRAFRLETSTVQRQAAAAVRAGLLERIPDPRGGAAMTYDCTDEGVRKLEASRTRSVRALHVILADWSDEDIAAFAHQLGRFNASIEDYNRRKSDTE
ncbi:winged helix-turn-helix transcriptional regulator [Cellulosimicrobium funkei]|nr:winged helix-turn-helix transcriptional regulator [Cellulosimicrobium funkei]